MTGRLKPKHQRLVLVVIALVVIEGGWCRLIHQITE